jgi:rSAM/selenodomain-associated transferase 2
MRAIGASTPKTLDHVAELTGKQRQLQRMRHPLCIGVSEPREAEQRFEHVAEALARRDLDPHTGIAVAAIPPVVPHARLDDGRLALPQNAGLPVAFDRQLALENGEALHQGRMAACSGSAVSLPRGNAESRACDDAAVVRISAVIPTLDEQGEVAGTVVALRREADEVIVVDGGSRDGTVEEARSAGAVVLCVPGANRAVALNAGAALAAGDVLYFVHADCRPPAGFAGDIRAAVADGASAGCFRLRYDWDHWLLRMSAWCTRVDLDLVRFGDQSLFVTRAALRSVCGFDERLSVMEDQDIVRRLRRRVGFAVLGRSVTTSARRYRANGLYRTQLVVYPLVVVLYRLGLPPTTVRRTYQRLLAW